MNSADDKVLGNLEAGQHNRKHERLYESRIDQGSVMEPIGKMQVLGNQHDLGKGQRVDQGEFVERVINVMLGEDHGPMNNEQGEHNKEIKRDDQVLSYLVARLSALSAGGHRSW